MKIANPQTVRIANWYENCKLIWKLQTNTKIAMQFSRFDVWFLLELYTDSVFSVGIRSVFLGIYHTDTEGILGRYISVSKRGQCPPFSSKGGQWPPFWEAPPHFGKKGGRKGGKYTKKGGIAPTEIPKIQQIWYRQNTDTEKIAGNTAVYNSTNYWVPAFILFWFLWARPDFVRDR